MPTDMPLPNISAQVRDAFERFRNDPEAQFVVKLRRHHAGDIRKLLSDIERLDLSTFNKEVWVYATSAKLGEKDVTKKLNFTVPIPPADLKELSQALNAGQLELHGNFIWGTATHIYGTSVPGGNDVKLGYIRQAVAILTDSKLEPIEKVERIADLPGFGRNITTGLCMVWHPESVALYNGKSDAGVHRLGYVAKDLASFQELAKHLKQGLQADDYLQLDWFLYLVGEGRIQMDSTFPKKMAVAALNTVLYGPPGTGKTYRTIERAVMICDGDAPVDRQELVNRFKTLRAANRIVFVTFHQSYGYEEFVEGIRPVLAEDKIVDNLSQDGQVRYECRDGVFKKLCSLAKAVSSSPEGGYDFDPKGIRIWKMSLGDTQDPEDEGIFEECIENNYVLLGYGEELDFEGCNSRQAVMDKLRTADKAIKGNDYRITSVNLLKNEMQAGDLVVVSEGNWRFRAIGKITGNYKFLTRDRYAQMRPVQWLVVYDESLPSDTILRKSFSQMTLYQLHPDILKLDALEELLSQRKTPGLENYVLIVDEINRGNISKILGELITLLEPDKRIGGENELVVKLPYSGDDFGVPANLYIVGTMNTADRSIAFLDTALRRRFRFEEVMPDSRIIAQHVGEKGKIGPVDVARLLDTINERIEFLCDRDHQLGHSYFLQVTTLVDLRDAFMSHVLPLLQEYFYGDWEKICVVLNCPYDPETAKLRSHNLSPILTARRLSADGLASLLDLDTEGRLRYEVNPAFLAGSGDDLVPFFLALEANSEDKESLGAD